MGTPGVFLPGGLALDVTAGKLYWTNILARKIQRANLDGTGVQDVLTAGPHAQMYGIALDIAGGLMYWVERFGDAGDKVRIRRARSDGSNPEDVVTGLLAPQALALDLSGNRVYWTDPGRGRIHRARLNGTDPQVLITAVESFGIALDVAGGKMYWTDLVFVSRANLDGSAREILFRGPAGLPSGPTGIALDIPAGKMYWTDIGQKKIQRANLDGTGVEDVLTSGFERPTAIALDTAAAPAPLALAAALLPSSRAVQVGQTATVFATLLASGSGTATSCTIAPTNAPPGTTFTYQMTNWGNQPIGTPNTPATIPGGQGQSFVLSLTPSSQVFGGTDIRFAFDCTNTEPVGVIPGVNTLALTSSSTPTPDIVALAATIANNGIVDVHRGGIGAFAVATVNVGTSASINVSTDYGDIIFIRAPAIVTLCQTNSTTGECLTPPTFQVTTQIVAGATPTYAIFVAEADGIPIGFNPSILRAFVRFTTQTGETVGLTSVAMRGI